MIEELYRLYAKDIYYYIYSLCKSQTLSEDLTSETFYQIMLSLSSFKGNSSIKTWIFSIARNVTYKELRKRKIEVNIDDFPSLGSHGPSNSLYAEEINKIMKTQSEINQRVFYLRLDGYTYDEIGEKLHVNPNSVRVIQHRNKKLIKNKLERSDEHERNM